MIHRQSLAGELDISSSTLRNIIKHLNINVKVDEHGHSYHAFSDEDAETIREFAKSRVQAHGNRRGGLKERFERKEY